MILITGFHKDSVKSPVLTTVKTAFTTDC